MLTLAVSNYFKGSLVKSPKVSKYNLGNRLDKCRGDFESPRHFGQSKFYFITDVHRAVTRHAQYTIPNA